MILRGNPMGKQLRKLIGTLLLVTAIVVTQIPVSDVEAEDSSAASDFNMDGTTLVKYNGTAENVSLSNQVKRIEAEAFAGNDHVRSVTLGDGVEVIGARAFSDCANLESVTIPDNVEIIENAAFSECPSLKSVSVGAGLKSLGNGVFAGDYSLSSVAFSSDNPYFVCDDGAIYNKKGWDVLYQVLAGRKADSYSMPSSVNKIRPYTFWGDYNLRNVSISGNVSEITGYAFSNCKNLKEVSIPYSVKSIDMKAFEDCVRLRDITIPISVSTIHSTAFDGCTKLNIHAEAGSYANSFAQTLVLDDIEVSEYEEAPVSGTVSENSAGEEAPIVGPVDYYHEVTHMNPMEAEEDDSRVKGKSRIVGREVYVLVDNAKATVNVGGTGEILGGEPVVEEPDLDTIPGLEGSEDAKGGSFPKYTVVNGETIAAQAYYDEDMTSCEIPGGIRRIGEFAYARASLNAVRIPDGVEEIGYAAFYHCDSLTDVVIPDSVKEIGVSAFDRTPWLSGWKSNVGDAGEFLIVGDGILLAYRGSGGAVTIPDSVKTIGPEAFKGLSSVESVQIPDSVAVIGEGAFEDCINLTAFSGAEGVQQIRDRAFAGCPIRTVTIPASVEQIGLRAFDNEKIKDGVIYFAGDKLPARSYENASTKLYRDDYRGCVFTGTRVAVIPSGVTDLTGTCLSRAGGDFMGVICRKQNDSAESASEDGTAENASEDASEGRTEASSRNDSVRTEDAAADRAAGDSKAAEAEPTVEQEEGSGILTILARRGGGPGPGETLKIGNRTYTLESGMETLSDVEREEPQTGITVKNNSYSIPQDSLVTAVMEGNDGSYRIDIADSEEAKTKIGDVYKSIYGNKLPHSLHAYDITMTDTETGVPITGLGKQRVEITMPLPSGVLQENMHVVCLDVDGQLEEVDSRIVSLDGKDAVAFQASHFSAYGIYNYGTGPAVADVKDGQAVFVSLGKKDASPDTGDNSIHPKYFLGAGLFFAAMAMFFYQKTTWARWKRKLRRIGNRK